MALQWCLQGIYLFTTIFGIGVTMVDMLGILGGEDHQVAGDHGDHGGAGHENAHNGAHAPLLSILHYLRMCVYFSLGFGPLGLIADAVGAGVLGSLAWAVPGGVAAALLAGAFFRFQHRDIDSSVYDEELLFERGRVIVPMSSKTMGKVRVKRGQAVVERYALAEDEGDAFRTGDVVEIVQVEDDPAGGHWHARERRGRSASACHGSPRRR